MTEKIAPAQPCRQRQAQMTKAQMTTVEDELRKRIAELEQILEQRSIESQTSQVLFHAFLDNLPAIAWTKDPQGFFTFANREFERCFQVPAMSLVGKTLFDVMSREDAEERWAAEQGVLETGQASVVEEVISQPVGGLRDKFTTRFAIRGPGGKIYGLGGIVIDITEQKRASEALRESQERFEDLIRRSNDWIWETNADGVYTYSSPQVESLLGYTPEEMIGRTPFEFMPPDEAARVIGIINGIVTAQKPIDRLENVNLRKDGTPVVLETGGVPFYDAQGNLKGYRGIDRDITARKRAEEVMRQEKEFSDAIINSLPGTFYMLDERRKLLRWNKNLETVAGRTAAELAQMTGTDFFETEDVARVALEIRRVFEEGRAAFEANVRVAGGKTVPFYLTGERVVVGDRTYVVGAGLDLTERKQAEQQAVALLAERARVRVLTEFVRNISHDFKTPLATINTSVYLQRRLIGQLQAHVSDTHQALLEQLERYVAVTQAQTDRLARLLEGTLTITRLDSTDALELRPLELNALVGDVFAHLKKLADEKAVGVTLELEAGTLIVEADTGDLNQAVWELARNAVQYTSTGGHIALRTHRQAQTAIIEVQDTGMGIAEDDLPHIFEYLYRADKARTTGASNAGLGLSIARRVVELHRGTVEVSSTLGQGSTFQIRLPLWEEAPSADDLDRPQAVGAI